MFLGRATTTRALNTIASAYREAADSWRLTKDLKNARLAMINSELAQISRQTAPCRSLIDQLKSERDALFAELNSKEFDFTFNQDYRHGKGISHVFIRTPRIISIYHFSRSSSNACFEKYE